MGWTIVLEEKSYTGYIFLKLRLFLFRTSVSDALINGFSHKNLEGLEPNLIIKPFSRTSFLSFINVCILKKSSKVVKTFGKCSQQVSSRLVCHVSWLDCLFMLSPGIRRQEVSLIIIIIIIIIIIVIIINFIEITFSYKMWLTRRIS